MIFLPLLTAACSGELEQHTERRGVIYSPSWPSNYPPAINCSWYIQGDHGDMITIRYGLIFVEVKDYFDETKQNVSLPDTPM